MSLGMLAALVETAAATRVTASLADMRQREMSTDDLLMLGHLRDVEGLRLLLNGISGSGKREAT